MKSTCLLIVTLMIIAGCAPSTRDPAIGPVTIEPDSNTVEVLYGTNRAVASGDCHYSGKRNTSKTLSYGTCTVSFPVDHRVGVIESPFFYGMPESPEHHVVIRNGKVLSREAFNQTLSARLGEKGASLMFIHGYNVTFEDAVKRTAQLAYDLKFDGAPVLFSWPSVGTTMQYTVDEASVSWSAPALYGFLKEHLANKDVKSVYIVAHSMGNRALANALVKLYAESPDLAAKLKEVVLAAPDIDADEFNDHIAPALFEKGAPVTLYASANDRALAASKQVHGYARAGEFRQPVTINPGIELIDVSVLESDFVGHSYYGDKVSVISDLYELFRGYKAVERTSLKAIDTPEGQYWEFRK